MHFDNCIEKIQYYILFQMHYCYQYTIILLILHARLLVTINYEVKYFVYWNY